MMQDPRSEKGDSDPLRSSELFHVGRQQTSRISVRKSDRGEVWAGDDWINDNTVRSGVMLGFVGAATGGRPPRRISHFHPAC